MVKWESSLDLLVSIQLMGNLGSTLETLVSMMDLQVTWKVSLA